MSMITQTNPKIKHVYLLGYPVAHSVSPAMQNAAFAALGMNWEYALLSLPREDLPRALARVRQDDCIGLNVTIPHKAAMFALLDDVGESARRIGAVNTLVKRDGKLIGENTDAYGFIQSLRDARVEPRGMHVAVLGAGGAARAVVFALAEAGAASIAIVNRTASRAALLGDTLKHEFPRLDISVNTIESLQNANLIVNATSVGMSPNVDNSPMPCAFPRQAIAFDLVYRPLQTRFLRDAERSGAQTINGLGMLVHQGAASFKLWTGRDAPVHVMFQAASREVER